MKTLKQIEIFASWKLKRFQTPLDEKLRREGCIRWLDIGCGDNFSDGFDYLDWFQSPRMPVSAESRFHFANIAELKDNDFDQLGIFDLVRMQHVFEHFSFEVGPLILASCARLLRPGGLLLLTVPDLRIYVKSYLSRRYSPLFTEFASGRVGTDAPSSSYFSVFAHSFGYADVHGHHKYRDEHRWCYDFEGVKHQLDRTGQFTKARRLGLFNPLSIIPFTHNRPHEDLCVVAERI